jgi:hypothetical protein
MKRSLLMSVLAGAFALGCSPMRHDENTARPPVQAQQQPETEPNAVTGAAATTNTGVDTTANPAAGDATGQTGTVAPNRSEPPGLEGGTETTPEPGEPQQNDVQDDDDTGTQTTPSPDRGD